MTLGTLAALKFAMDSSEVSKADVAEMCSAMFGKSKFSELTPDQQWTLVCAVRPSVTGPFGCSMAPM